MSVACTEEARASMETDSHGDLLPSTGSESISSFHTASSIGQLALSHFQRNQLWIAGEQIDASTYNLYSIESFMEYLLESSDLREDSYSISEGALIRGSHAIRRLVRKIVETLATMLPNRDFVVGLIERVY